jgi:hypothetical protein
VADALARRATVSGRAMAPTASQPGAAPDPRQLGVEVEHLVEYAHPVSGRPVGRRRDAHRGR